MASIQAGPHYEIPAAELAAWIEQQGLDVWWNVDGDPLLTGRLSLPCPGDELAKELRDIDRPLLAEAKAEDAQAQGQRIDASGIGPLLTRYLGELRAGGKRSARARDRFFYLCWQGSPHEWLLVEDSVTTEQYRQEEASQAK